MPLHKLKCDPSIDKLARMKIMSDFFVQGLTMPETLWDELERAGHSENDIAIMLELRVDELLQKAAKAHRKNINDQISGRK